MFRRKKKKKEEEKEKSTEAPQEEQDESPGETEEVSSDDSAGSHEPQEGSGAGVVIESRNWYRDKFRQTITLSMILAAVMVGSLVANVIQAVTSAPPRYFAVTEDLRVQELQPLSEPTVNQDGLFNWTTRTITETFSLDFAHWRDKLMEVKPNYTEDAFGDLLESLQESGNLEMVRERRLVLSTAVDRSPVIKSKGELEGRMAWKLEFPITLSYESSEGVVATKDLVCEVLIHRVPVTDHPRGIKIAQVVLQ